VPHVAGRGGSLERLARVAGPAEKSLTGLFGALGASLSRLGGQFGHFVQLASPAAVVRFNQVLRDTQAVIGQILLPVLERFTLFLRKIGDALISLDAPTKKVLAGFGAGAGLTGVVIALAAAGTLLVRTLGGLPVLLAPVAQVVGAVVKVFAAVVGVGAQVARVVTALVEALLRLVGAVAGGVLSVIGRRVGLPAGALVTALEYLASALERELGVGLGGPIRLASAAGLRRLGRGRHPSCKGAGGVAPAGRDPVGAALLPEVCR